MISILMKNADVNALEKVRPLCSHENPATKLEAIKCLLVANDSEGITVLRSILISDDGEIFNKALQLAVAFKLKDVLPELRQIIKKKAMSGKYLEEKIPVVRAVGQIGDPEGFDYLKDMLSAKSFLFRRSLEKLKKEIRIVLKTHDKNFVS